MLLTTFLAKCTRKKVSWGVFVVVGISGVLSLTTGAEAWTQLTWQDNDGGDSFDLSSSGHGN